ncbi:limbic system-associated membrane protein-like isoform X2 [Physella acuta]|uniref:limbic system-associated membrane protein-like isoform X2 n=1 Tax=Physella acuta TaxID=109671 RepID=UPI0027DE2D4B|nr:limbic system-associated membrane protein-like isoform X2 [Physella acuta]
MKDWNLHIRDVKIKDQGLYSCQINTHPVKIKTVYLTVQVPAKILNNSSTDAVVAREGTTVTLTCNVDGLPIPNVTWYRITTTSKGETKKSEFCPGSNTVGMRGEVLIIHNVSRHCGDTYECWAFNGVPPAISKYIKVSVEFPPEITMPNVAIGQDLGKETILECSITANPQPVVTWKKNGVDIKTTAGRYRVEPYPETEFTMSLGLKIQVIEPADFGIYTCVATNKVGADSKEMLLYDYTLRRMQTKGQQATKTTISTTLLPPYPGTYHPKVSQKAPHYEGYEQEQEDRRITKVVKDNQQSGTHKPIGLGVPSTENKGTALIGWLSTCLLCVLVNLSLVRDVLFLNGRDYTL